MPPTIKLGVSLTALTVSKKVSLAVPLLPSVTVKVIVLVPDKFAAGVTVTVRLVPAPAKTILAFGTKVVLLEVPDIVKAVDAVSTSPMVKVSAVVAASSLIVWLVTSVIVGGVFALIVMVKV